MRTNDHHPILSKKRETKVILLLLEIEVQNELIRRGAKTIEPKTENRVISNYNHINHIFINEVS